MARLTLTVAFVAMLTASCEAQQPVTIDGTTQESFERTAADARRQLPDADRLVFDRALRTVGARRLANRDPQALARVTFDGMTAEEVVADQRERD
ncbi:MAG TPA: hypothetical protein VD768_07505 [Sphingomicrobium sp.]|nr:hypothetical protein [Sphingomicrobium sp.]